MPVHQKRRQQAKVIRATREVHRTAGIVLFVFFSIMAVTGVLLGWKKNSNGYILAKTESGSSSDLTQWLSVDSLYNIAKTEMARLHPDITNTVKRMDVRPSKGVVKFTFEGHFNGLQIDGATGAILSHERRRSDLIEQIHDGSIVDDLMGWDSGVFKLIYTTIMGLSLLVFTVTGFWLWYGPIRMRRSY